MGLGNTNNIIILNTIRLAPRTHHKRIVIRNHSDDINALGFDGGQVLDVAGEMLDGAAGCEGAGDGEEDDFLVGPFCGCQLEGGVGANEGFGNA